MAHDSETLRMNAYYYSFEPTGVLAVDRVLAAVASAGKSYHNTSEWTDDTDWQGNRQAPHPEFGGASCAEWIQNAANDAAAALAAETARANRAEELTRGYYNEAATALEQRDEANRRADHEATARREVEKERDILSLSTPCEDELSPRIDELLSDIAVEQWRPVAVARLLKDCQRRMADDWVTVGREIRSRRAAEAERDALRAQLEEAKEDARIEALFNDQS